MDTVAEKTAAYISRRESGRLAAGRLAWSLAEEDLRKMGVSAELFGSMARGTVHDRSDIDVLVLCRNGYGRGAILRIIEDHADDISVDVLFAEDLPAHKVLRMRSEAKA